MTALRRIRQALFAGLVGAAVVFSGGAVADETERFEAQLDETIRAACHGYLLDAVPDALGWLRTQLQAHSPFCRRVETAFDEQAVGELVREAWRATGPELDLSAREDRDLAITIECDGEYMCIESRLRHLDSESPVTGSDYDIVARYCDGRYGCIQAFFDDWPAPLPEPVPVEEVEMVTFASMFPAPASTATPTPNVTPTGVDEAAPAPEAARVVTSERATPELLALNDRLRQTCRCSLASGTCYENPNGPIRDHIARMHAQRRALCEDWQRVYAGLDADAAVELERARRELGATRMAIRETDQRAQRAIQIATDEFMRMRSAIQSGRRYQIRDYLPQVEALVQEGVGRPAPIESAVAIASSPSAESSVRDERPAPSALPTAPLELRLDFRAAEAYCARSGQRLPSVEEAMAQVGRMRPDHEIRGRPQYFYGIWTREEVPALRMARTVRFNRDVQGVNPSEQNYVVCVD